MIATRQRDAHFAIFLLLAAIGSWPLSAQQCRALIVGVSTYQDPAFSQLKHAVNDANAFSAWFNGPRCAGRKAPPVILTEAAATQTAIQTELSRMLLTAGKSDEVFVFISARALKTPDYAEGYLLGYDARRGKLHPSGIAVQDFLNVLSQGVGRLFLFADISRELPNRESPKRNQIVSFLEEKLARLQLSALLSTQPGQLSIEDTGFPEGFFTHFLTEELRSGAPRDVASVFKNLRSKMTQSKPKQEPYEFGATTFLITGARRAPLLLAALGVPAQGLFAPQQPQTPTPSAPTPAERALDEAARLEQEAQTILLRYGEGNQFPEDPLRPGATAFDHAGELFEQVLRVRPALPGPVLNSSLLASLTARALFCRGRALAYRGQYDDARTLLQKANAADPLLPEPYNAIGITYLEQAQYVPALEAFRKSIEIAKDWAYPRHNLALTYMEMGDNHSAESEYRAAIQRTPQHPYLYYNLGILLQRINRRSEAEDVFRTAIQKFEDQIGAYRQRAASLGRENPQAAAASALDLEEAETAARNEGEAYNALGVLWQSQGKRSKARQSYETALKLNDKLYAARYNLGVLAFKDRRYSDAVSAFESVVSNLPQAQPQLDCARKGVEYTQTRDSNQKRQLRQELKNCPAQ